MDAFCMLALMGGAIIWLLELGEMTGVGITGATGAELEGELWD